MISLVAISYEERTIFAAISAATMDDTVIETFPTILYPMLISTKSYTPKLVKYKDWIAKLIEKMRKTGIRNGVINIKSRTQKREENEAIEIKNALTMINIPPESAKYTITLNNHQNFNQ